MVSDDARAKDRSLAEVLRFVNESADVNVVGTDHADDLVDFALLNLIEEGLVEHTLLTHLLLLLHGCMLCRYHLALAVLCHLCNGRLFKWLRV